MKNNTKLECYQILAANRYAKCPDHIGIRQFSAVRAVMEKDFRREWFDTPEGLYTDVQIWKQTHSHWLKYGRQTTANKTNKTNN